MAEPNHPREGERVPADAVRAPVRVQPAEIRPEHLYKTAGLLFLFGVLLRFLQPITEVLLLAYSAVILAVLFNAVVQQVPLGRKWMSAVIGLVLLGTISAVAWFGVPILLRQVRDVVARGPEFRAQVQSLELWIESHLGLNVELMGPQASEIVRNVFLGGGSAGNVLARAQGAVGALLIPLLIIMGALYATAQPNSHLLSPLLRAVPRDRRLAFRRIFQLLGDRLLGWARGVLLAMVGVGLLSLALYSLIGVPNAFLLALVAALTEAIPLLGPWVGGMIAVGVALVDDPTKALYVAIAAVAIQQVEGNFITPYAMSRAADVHPFVTLFALLLFGTLFGFLGVLLSIPIVLLLATLLEVLWIERAIDTDEDRISPVVDE